MHTARIALTAGLCLLLAGIVVGSEREEEEPPFLFTLEVNGLDYSIEPGELITLPPHKGELRIRLRVEPFRVLKADGVEFRFPRSWAARREKEKWVVQRGVFEVEIKTYRNSDAVETAESWAKHWEELSKMLKVTKWRVVRSDRPLSLGGAKVKGVTVTSDTGRVRTAYFLGSGRDTVRLLLKGDRRRGDELCEEWREMERWLEKSLKVVPE